MSGGGLSLPLPHVRTPEPAWWSTIAATVPILGADSASEVWKGPRYDVIAHYDTSGEYATLVVRDSAKKEWPAGRLPTPTRRVFRLDITSVDTMVRRGLARAFDQSTLYSGSARTVLGPRRVRSRIVFTRWSGSASTPARAIPRRRLEERSVDAPPRVFPSPRPFLMPRMRAFTAPDSTTWGVEVQNPGASNAVVLFRHPNGQTGRLDRYAWYILRVVRSRRT